MKDGASLDDLAEQFSTNPIQGNFTKTTLLAKNITTENILSVYETMFCYKEVYDFRETLILFIFSEILKRGNSSNVEIKALITMLHKTSSLDDEHTLIFCRKLGVSSWLLIKGDLVTSEEDLKIIENYT